MKIVHVCLNKRGGAAQAAWRLHKALLAHDVDSWFYTLEPRGEENTAQNWVCWKPANKSFWQRSGSWIRRKYYEVLEYKNLEKLKRIRRAYDAPLLQLKAEMISWPDADKNLLDDGLFKDADIIHLHWVSYFIKYHDFFRRASGRYQLCWTLHDLQPVRGIFHYDMDSTRNPQAKQLDMQVEAYKKNCISDYGKKIIAIAPNSWMLQQVKQSAFSSLFEPCEIPYSISVRHPKQGDAEPLPQQATITGATVLLTVLDNIEVDRKQAAMVLEAAADFPTLQFWIVGADEPRQQQLPANIKFWGFIKNPGQMQQLYSAAAAVIISSAEDNLPNVMLEAFANGTPVLAFAVGGLQQYVLNGLTGLTTKEISLLGLKQLIKNFLQEKEAFNRQAIKDFACEHFSPAIIAGKHKVLYQSMLTSKS